jgi:predicted secreted protein
VSASTYTKGQFVRLFLSSDGTTAPAKVIAAAKSLSLHVAMTLEDATTKDTTGNWQVQEPTGLNYDISTSALVRGNDTITSQTAAQDLASIEDIYEAGTPVLWQIANVSGANQRTKGTVIASGSVLLTQLTMNGPNRQNATYDVQLSGFGAYTVGA